MDLIDRQQAIDAIVNCTNCGDEKTLRAYVAKHNLDNGWTGGILEAIDAIEDLPSAEPEIIRCKDCKYIIDTGDDLMCDNAKGWVVATTSGFGCVLAERRIE